MLHRNEDIGKDRGELLHSKRPAKCKRLTQLPLLQADFIANYDTQCNRLPLLQADGIPNTERNAHRIQVGSSATIPVLFPC